MIQHLVHIGLGREMTPASVLHLHVSTGCGMISTRLIRPGSFTARSALGDTIRGKVSGID